jgi:hypothetical protein
MGNDISGLTTFSILCTVCLGLLLLGLPRRYAVIPFIVTGCYMTVGESIIVGGGHFTILRIMVSIGLVRVFLRKELFTVRFNSIDIIWIAWVIFSSFLSPIFLGPQRDFVNRIGLAYSSLGLFFVFRALIRDKKDVLNTVLHLAIIIIPLGVFFIYEKVTGNNLFSSFGGVPEMSDIRDGRIRCQGPFRHSILAGTFGATSFPLFVGLWLCKPERRYLITMSIVASTIIMITSSSSGPFITFLAGIVALLCWNIRSHMRAIRWGIVLLLIGLHAVMKAPVWFILSRMSDLFGGSGYYRSALIDASIKHFNEWWLLGTTYTAHWMPTGIPADPNMADITNQFIQEGINGGILTLALFVCIFVKCFQVIGKAMITNNNTSKDKYALWAIGCCIFGHILSMFSVGYFDQMKLFWVLVISIVAAYCPNKRAYINKVNRLSHLPKTSFHHWRGKVREGEKLSCNRQVAASPTP